MRKSKNQIIQHEEMEMLKEELNVELNKFEAAVEDIEACAQRLEKEMDELVKSVEALEQAQELQSA